ncbi:excinuclease ABC subunit C [Listeria floridensis FSL S10-1187]|uniref:Excinuclease ABC subunit C n=1 Tax=Listeria floridensis FSL S10-1187 TaxID=1265817 RepID=A0ABP3B0T9_9LIST|nr:excinuclease ABC subunit UvrC [Listeria floridensis]EUJ33172.1 excinuclease ABC subunit C [Listeria floridensis FSL S10-1187]
MSETKLQQKLRTLPEVPGCYIYRDKMGEILYIGKSKNLKKRVKSYFTKTQTGKTARLVHYIADVELIVTSSEKEALLLEMSLIMKYQPPYNILLKDEIHYSYIKITSEVNPRLEVTREIKKDGGMYFGPYVGTYAAEKTKEFLQKIYPLCHCSGKRGRPCFYYHLGMCIGPCARDVSDEEYAEQIRKIKHFLSGGHQDVRRELKQKLDGHIERLEFERAKEIHNLLESLDRVTEKQKVVTKDGGNRDVIDFVRQDDTLSIQIFFIRNGAIVGRFGQIIEDGASLEDEAVVESFVVSFYDHPNHLLPAELFVGEGLNAELLCEVLGIKVKMPKRGDKRAIVGLVSENARSALDAHLKMRQYELEEQL